MIDYEKLGLRGEEDFVNTMISIFTKEYQHNPELTIKDLVENTIKSFVHNSIPSDTSDETLRGLSVIIGDILNYKAAEELLKQIKEDNHDRL